MQCCSHFCCKASVCWQCGDIGLTEALVYCSKCKVAPRHRYCLEELPEELSEEINWLCEYCRLNCTNSVSKAAPSISQKIESHGSKESKAENPPHGKSSVNDDVISKEKHLITATKIDASLNVEHRALDITSICNNLSLGAMRSSQCSEEDKIDSEVKEKPKRRRLILADEDEFECTNSPSNSSLKKHKTKQQCKGRPKKRILLLADVDESDSTNSSSIQSFPKTTSAKITNHEEEPNNPCQDPIIENQRVQHIVKDHSLTEFPYQPTIPVVPVFAHIWSGCFNISNTEFGPFNARLSSRACKKVCDISRLLPLVLQMEKLPRLDAWPNSFKNSPPTNDNIALVFYSGSDCFRVEAELDGLVDDIINDDLMLRCHFDEVELLIFSSFVLPEEHQRLLGKYYIWGVFKPRVHDIRSTASQDDLAEGIQLCEALKPGSQIELNDDENRLSNSCTYDVNIVTAQQSTNLQCDTAANVVVGSTTQQGRNRKPSVSVEFVHHDSAKGGDEENSRFKHITGDRERVIDPVIWRSRPDEFTDKLQCVDLEISREQEISSEMLRGEGCQDKSQGRLRKPAQDLQRELAKISGKTSRVEFCGDNCRGGSQCNGNCSLELFPVHMEDMAIAVRVRASKKDIHLKLDRGLPSFDYECKGKALKKNFYLDSSILR